VALALAPGRERVLCPAMNPNMLGPRRSRGTSASSRATVDAGRAGAGRLACGDEGRGRLAEPAEIVAAAPDLMG
jgi:phosphopantothenoylcysteine decarboxylase/phosphopantothenate--cysteine ligase